MTDVFFLFTFIFLAIVGSVLLFLTRLHNIRRELRKDDEELRRKAVQASVITELMRRMGYTLNVQEIVEVIIGSLGQIINFSTVSYLLWDKDKDVLNTKIQLQEPVNRAFLNDVKERMIASFSVLHENGTKSFSVDEHFVGIVSDETSTTKLRSFFNLPLIIGGEAVGLITVASTKPGLYTDADTAILYQVTELASTAVHKLTTVIENEERKMNAMVSSLVGGLLMVDQEDRLSVINPRAKEIFGFPKDYYVWFHDLVEATRSWLDIAGLIQESITDPKKTVKREVSFTDRYYDIFASAVLDRNGVRIGTVILMYDVTAEHDLARLRQDFTAMMVHDLRAPLTAMQWTLESVLDQPKPTKASLKEPVGLLKESSAQMLSIVNDLLDVSKMESGKFEISPKPDDIGSVIEETVAEFKPLAGQKRIQLAATVPASVPPITFDHARINQVLANLLSNAIKFTDNGSVTISAQILAKTDRLRVSVADTGFGISPAAQQKLFQRFSQVGDAEHQTGGTGLGLAIVKGVIEAHKGTVGVASKPGKGSTFWFELPLS